MNDLWFPMQHFRVKIRYFISKQQNVNSLWKWNQKINYESDRFILISTFFRFMCVSITKIQFEQAFPKFVTTFATITDKLKFNFAKHIVEDGGHEFDGLYEAHSMNLRQLCSINDQIRPLKFVTERLRLHLYNPNLNSNQNMERKKNATQHNEKAIKSSYIANLIPIKRLPFTATANFQHTKHEKKNSLCEACVY